MGKNFSLTVHVRNKKGEPTGKTRHFETDDAVKLAEWFDMNGTVETVRKSTKKKKA